MNFLKNIFINFFVNSMFFLLIVLIMFIQNDIGFINLKDIDIWIYFIYYF